MARIRRIENADLTGNGSLYIGVNAVLRDKYSISISDQKYVWSEKHVCVVFTCKKCGWGYALTTPKFHEMGLFHEEELKRHYYLYHKERRNKINMNAPIHKVQFGERRLVRIDSEISKKETKDCVVVAFAVAFDLSYDDAHGLLARHGREDRAGTPHYVSWAAINEMISTGFWKCAVRNDLWTWGEWNRDTLRRNKGTTLNGLIPSLDPSKRYLVTVNGHMFAFKDGKIFDFTKGGKRRITDLWEIEWIGD